LFTIIFSGSYQSVNEFVIHLVNLSVNLKEAAQEAMSVSSAAEHFPQLAQSATLLNYKRTMGMGQPQYDACGQTSCTTSGRPSVLYRNFLLWNSEV
jgi:hypothetical protein